MFKKILSGDLYATDPKMWTCSCPAYLNSHFLLCKYLVQSVCLLKPNFFNKVIQYRSLSFWRHNDLILLAQGLEPVEEDELEEFELINEKNMPIEDMKPNDETDKELAEALQEYEESDDTIDNIIVEKSNKIQEQYRDTQFLLAAENAMYRIEKMLAK
ncbi:15544_t:CDS:2, partial [Racocetra persica]